MTFHRVSRDRGTAALGRLAGPVRIIAVLVLLLAILAPALATFGVPASSGQSSCHATGIDLELASVVQSDAAQSEDPVGVACDVTACAMSTCMAVPLPARFGALGHDDIILAVSFDGGGRPGAGIGVSPGFRPPIRAIAT